MPTHNKLLILVGLPAQGALLTSVIVRKFLVSLLILKQGLSFLLWDSHIRFLSSSPMHSGSSTMGYSSLISVSIVEAPCCGWFSSFSNAISVFIQNETNLAQMKMKALADSSLYGPYQVLSSSNLLLQALFTGIAISKGINGECNFF